VFIHVIGQTACYTLPSLDVPFITSDQFADMPRWSSAAWAEYAVSVTRLRVVNEQVGYSYRSTTYYEPANNPFSPQGGYGRVNARLTRQWSSPETGRSPPLRRISPVMSISRRQSRSTPLGALHPSAPGDRGNLVSRRPTALSCGCSGAEARPQRARLFPLRHKCRRAECVREGMHDETSKR
jgi:hypothetical protein